LLPSFRLGCATYAGVVVLEILHWNRPVADICTSATQTA